MIASYQNIYDSEIWQQSQCIWHENALMDFFRTQLSALGYERCSDSGKIWQRRGQQVIVCLVDDFTSCSQDWSTKTPYLFDPNTIVITDNLINCPTQYRVARLPDSFFGIYCHSPSQSIWNPQRRFNFAVNRIDNKRLLLFLELIQRAHLQGCHDTTDYMNFNCWSWQGKNDSVEALQENFRREFNTLENIAQGYHKTYGETFRQWQDRMPLRNHDLDHETVHVSAWLNITPETYSSDNVIALSEKTFRVLCRPAPWMLYSGRHTIARLTSLGFDVLQDVIAHRYDSMIENHTARYGDKMVDFIFEAADSVESMMDMKFSDLQIRCAEAAKHNREVLTEMRSKWSSDFATWWYNTIPLIA
jgi:hypothetical protein